MSNSTVTAALNSPLFQAGGHVAAGTFTNGVFGLFGSSRTPNQILLNTAAVATGVFAVAMASMYGPTAAAELIAQTPAEWGLQNMVAQIPSYVPMIGQTLLGLGTAVGIANFFDTIPGTSTARIANPQVTFQDVSNLISVANTAIDDNDFTDLTKGVTAAAERALENVAITVTQGPVTRRGWLNTAFFVLSSSLTFLAMWKGLQDIHS